jgi:putative membrane protein
MRRGLLVAAAVVFAVAMVGPLERLASERSMALHMVQHLLLLSAVPALIAHAVPRVLGPRSLRLGRTTAGAVGCIAIGTAAVYVLHLPVLVNSGLEHWWWNAGQHVVLVAAGLVLAWPVLSPEPLPGFGAVRYLVAAEILIGLLGIVITWSPTLLYDAFAPGDRLGGLSPLDDQAVAGAILLVVEEPLLLAELAVLFIRALETSEE